jgi:hypothetical protein
MCCLRHLPVRAACDRERGKRAKGDEDPTNGLHRVPSFPSHESECAGGRQTSAYRALSGWARLGSVLEGDQAWPALTAFLRRLGPQARRDLRRVLASEGDVRADVIKQFHERERPEMTEFLILLEEQEVGRLAVIQEIDRLDR